MYREGVTGSGICHVGQSALMTNGVSPSAALRASLDVLAERVESASFTWPAAEQSKRRARQADLAWNVREYLLPRLRDLEAPLLVVVIGSTGAGKSTLVNSLAQEPVSEVGAIRPTTRVPVVWTHSDHAHRYQDGFLTGYSTAADAGRRLRIVTGTQVLLEGVTVLDALDFDSVVEGHREMVEDLLAVADLTVFVTSAQRYADAVPWEFLERARRRRLPIIFVLNRLPSQGADEIVADYLDRLSARKIMSQAEARIILRIPEQRIGSDHGGLPPDTVAVLRDTLETLSNPEHRRRVVVTATRVAPGRDLDPGGSAPPLAGVSWDGRAFQGAHQRRRPVKAVGSQSVRRSPPGRGDQ
jgi:GTPase SAR1 family protein